MTPMSSILLGASVGAAIAVITIVLLSIWLWIVDKLGFIVSFILASTIFYGFIGYIVMIVVEQKITDLPFW